MGHDISVNIEHITHTCAIRVLVHILHVSLPCLNGHDSARDKRLHRAYLFTFLRPSAPPQFLYRDFQILFTDVSATGKRY